MTEASATRSLIDALRRARLDPHRVENACELGTPDINFAIGWIEAKYSNGYTAQGVLRVQHDVTPQQQVWLDLRWRHGGLTFVVWRVDRIGWWLIPGGSIRELYRGVLTAGRLVGLAHWYVTADALVVGMLERYAPTWRAVPIGIVRDNS